MGPDNLRFLGIHTFTEPEIDQMLNVISNGETIEFDFYDARGQDSVQNAERYLPRNHRPLFRIKMSIQSGRLNEMLVAGTQLVSLCIEDIRQGRGKLIEESPCYFTTAACRAVGLSDECWELQTLRRFRDETLPGLPNGSSDINRYYEEAPRVLARLKESPLVRKRLLQIYWLTIVPCALLARFQANRLCHWLYRRQHDKLTRQFRG